MALNILQKHETAANFQIGLRSIVSANRGVEESQYELTRAKIILYLNQNKQWLQEAKPTETLQLLSKQPFFKKGSAPLYEIYFTENFDLIRMLPAILEMPLDVFTFKIYFKIGATLSSFSPQQENLYLANLLKYQKENVHNPIHKCLLAQCYAKEEKPKDAFALYLKASDALPIAIYCLAICYRDGRGVQENIHQALNLMAKAAEQGVPLAWAALGDLYSGDKDPELTDLAKSLSCYQKALESGIFSVAENMQRVATSLGVVTQRAQASSGTRDSVLNLPSLPL